MGTEKFMGVGQLIDRLTEQIKSAGYKGDAKAAAMEQLRKRGHIDAYGNLTDVGRERNSMTAEERAKDRASKRTGKPASNFNYDPTSNKATPKKGF